jgi:hypothetical protein
MQETAAIVHTLPVDPSEVDDLASSFEAFVDAEAARFHGALRLLKPGGGHAARLVERRHRAAVLVARCGVRRQPVLEGVPLHPARGRIRTDYALTFPEGWTVQNGHVYLKRSDLPDEICFYAVDPDAIYADACEGDDDLMEVGPSVDDDLTVPERVDLEACRSEGIGLQIWYSPPADKYFVLLGDGIASVYIVDVDGERQVFLTQHRSATSEEDLRELQAILGSILIET